MKILMIIFKLLLEQYYLQSCFDKIFFDNPEFNSKQVLFMFDWIHYF